jgi:hypothetical protein
VLVGGIADTAAVVLAKGRESTLEIPEESRCGLLAGWADLRSVGCDTAAAAAAVVAVAPWYAWQMQHR